MPEKRINYLITCKRHTSTCSCCRRCQNLGWDLVHYAGKSGYYFRTEKSSSLLTAQKILERNFKIPEFNLEPLRGRIGKKKMKVLKKGSPRQASVAQSSSEEEEKEEEEMLVTKRLKTSSSNGVKAEPSTKVFEEKIQQLSERIKFLERGQEKNERRFQKYDEKFFKFLENQDSQIKANANTQKELINTMRTEIRDSNENMMEQFRIMNQANHERTFKSLQLLGSRNQGQARASDNNEAHPSPNAPITKKSAQSHRGSQSEYPFLQLLQPNMK